MLVAILMATPCFVLFGWLSDKIGRKWIMLLGMLLAICTYRPIYKEFIAITSASNRTQIIDRKAPC
jgi:MFS family permease